MLLIFFMRLSFIRCFTDFLHCYFEWYHLHIAIYFESDWASGSKRETSIKNLFSHSIFDTIWKVWKYFSATWRNIENKTAVLNRARASRFYSNSDKWFIVLNRINMQLSPDYVKERVITSTWEWNYYFIFSDKGSFNSTLLTQYQRIKWYHQMFNNNW